MDKKELIKNVDEDYMGGGGGGSIAHKYQAYFSFSSPGFDS